VRFALRALIGGAIRSDGGAQGFNATQPQPSSDRDFRGIQQLLKIEWLGRRDSNPDTQIQSPLNAPTAQLNQQHSAANQGEVGQNPQHGRNTEMDLKEGIDLLPTATFNHLEFDFEEDTLP